MIAAIRSHCTAGLAAALVTAAVTTPLPTPASPVPPLISSAAVELAAALLPLPEPLTANVTGMSSTPGDWIINAYNAIQPWVAYGVELFAWAVEWLPWPIGLLAPQADIIYSGWQPFAESVVYSLAFLVDGQFDLILPTLSNGIQTGISTLIQGEIDWIASFFPPLPPIGVAASSRTAGRESAAPAQSESAPVAAVVAEPTPVGDAKRHAQRAGLRPQRSAPVPAPTAAGDNPAEQPSAEPTAAAHSAGNAQRTRTLRGQGDGPTARRAG